MKPEAIRESLQELKEGVPEAVSKGLDGIKDPVGRGGFIKDLGGRFISSVVGKGRYLSDPRVSGSLADSFKSKLFRVIGRGAEEMSIRFNLRSKACGKDAVAQKIGLLLDRCEEKGGNEKLLDYIRENPDQVLEGLRSSIAFNERLLKVDGVLETLFASISEGSPADSREKLNYLRTEVFVFLADDLLEISDANGAYDVLMILGDSSSNPADNLVLRALASRRCLREDKDSVLNNMIKWERGLLAAYMACGSSEELKGKLVGIVENIRDENVVDICKMTMQERAVGVLEELGFTKDDMRDWFESVQTMKERNGVFRSLAVHDHERLEEDLGIDFQTWVDAGERLDFRGLSVEEQREMMIQDGLLWQAYEEDNSENAGVYYEGLIRDFMDEDPDRACFMFFAQENITLFTILGFNTEDLTKCCGNVSTQRARQEIADADKEDVLRYIIGIDVGAWIAAGAPDDDGPEMC